MLNVDLVRGIVGAFKNEEMMIDAMALQSMASYQIPLNPFVHSIKGIHQQWS